MPTTAPPFSMNHSGWSVPPPKSDTRSGVLVKIILSLSSVVPYKSSRLCQHQKIPGPRFWCGINTTQGSVCNHQGLFYSFRRCSPARLRLKQTLLSTYLYKTQQKCRPLCNCRQASEGHNLEACRHSVPVWFRKVWGKLGVELPQCRVG